MFRRKKKFTMFDKLSINAQRSVIEHCKEDTLKQLMQTNWYMFHLAGSKYYRDSEKIIPVLEYNLTYRSNYDRLNNNEPYTQTEWLNNYTQHLQIWSHPASSYIFRQLPTGVIFPSLRDLTCQLHFVVLNLCSKELQRVRFLRDLNTDPIVHYELLHWQYTFDQFATSSIHLDTVMFDGGPIPAPLYYVELILGANLKHVMLTEPTLEEFDFVINQNPLLEILEIKYPDNLLTYWNDNDEHRQFALSNLKRLKEFKIYYLNVDLSNELFDRILKHMKSLEKCHLIALENELVLWVQMFRSSGIALYPLTVLLTSAVDDSSEVLELVPWVS